MTTNGRVVPPLRELTFPTSGKTIQLRRISPNILARIREEISKTLPPPDPPMEEVQYGTGKRMQPNTLHPLYVSLYRRWQQEYGGVVGEKLLNYILHNGVVVDCEDGDVQHDIAQVREQCEREGITLEDDDAFVYVVYCCMLDDGDMELLRDAVFRGSMPTEEAIQAAVDSFRGDVSGS